MDLDSEARRACRGSVGIVLYDLRTDEGRLAYQREISAILDPWSGFTPSRIPGWECEGDAGYVLVSLSRRISDGSN